MSGRNFRRISSLFMKILNFEKRPMLYNRYSLQWKHVIQNDASFCMSHFIGPLDMCAYLQNSIDAKLKIIAKIVNFL